MKYPGRFFLCQESGACVVAVPPTVSALGSLGTGARHEEDARGRTETRARSGRSISPRPLVRSLMRAPAGTHDTSLRA